MYNDNSLVLGNYIWDRTTHDLQPLSLNGETELKETVRLTNKQKALLSCLADAYPQPLTRSEIVKQVWSNEFISPESLPQLINRTRKTLGDTEKTILRNIPNVGYIIEAQAHKPSASEAEEKTAVQQNLELTKPPHADFKSKIRMLVVIVMLALTSYNILNFYNAYVSKQQFIDSRFAEPYPLLKTDPKNGATTIILDDGECKYEKDSQTMDCRQI